MSGYFPKIINRDEGYNLGLKNEDDPEKSPIYKTVELFKTMDYLPLTHEWKI